MERITLTTLRKKSVDPASKALIVFDFDGTLAESKQPMDAEMAKLVRALLKTRKVAVIGGGKYELFRKLFVAKLHASKGLLKNLFLFPTTATSFYKYSGGWKSVYSHKLTLVERKRIFRAFEQAFEELHYAHPKKMYGKLIEDRGSQVTFSALGQKAPLNLKNAWVAKNAPMKLRIAKRVQSILPELEVRAAGYTSIDVTHKGIDKGYGIRQMEKYLKIPRKQMLFVGDALFKGGNDHAVLKTGVDAVAVKGPEEAKKNHPRGYWKMKPAEVNSAGLSHAARGAEVPGGMTRYSDSAMLCATWIRSCSTSKPRIFSPIRASAGIISRRSRSPWSAFTLTRKTLIFATVKMNSISSRSFSLALRKSWASPRIATTFRF
jgi:phosphomannomutase